MVFGKKKAVGPAPRGYYRGPLPLPGRDPVSLGSYRKAAVRATQTKHRDQARDKYVLARNRRAQLIAAGQLPQAPAPEALPPPPMVGFGPEPLAITGPPAPVLAEPGFGTVYGGAPFYGGAPIYGGAPVYDAPAPVYDAPIYGGYGAPAAFPAAVGGYPAFDAGYGAPAYGAGFGAGYTQAW